MPTVYPATDTDTPRALLNSMGTFWSDIFPQPQQVIDTISSRLLAHNRVRQQMTEAINAVSRKTIDPLHTEPLSRLSILLSSLTRIEELYALDEGLTLDTGLKLDEGPVTSQYVYDCLGTIPAQLAAIQNGLTTPSRILVSGVDFMLQDGQLHFIQDPFADDDYKAHPVYDEFNSVSDYRIDFWTFQAKFDRQAISKQVGYEVELAVPSTTTGRDFVNAVLDLSLDGPTPGALGRALSALLAAPLAVGGETVTLISTDRRGAFIATDKRVYRFSDSATAVVVVGDSLVPGQALTNALSLQSLLPTSDIPYLTVQSAMIDACYGGPITFANENKTLVVSTVADYTYVAWELDGDSDDIDNFFVAAHDNGIERIGALDSCGREITRGTIAQWLDNRVNPVGEPTAANLPATINPFQFLCENCLQGNAWLVKLRLASCGSGGIGLQYVETLRRFLPKQMAIFFAVETSDQDDQIKTWLRDVTILPAT